MLYLNNMYRLWAVLIIFTGVQVFAEFSKEYHESFKVEKGTQLYLRHGDGDVTIRPWNQNELKVDVIYRATGAADDDRMFRVDFDQRDQKIYIVGKEFRKSWSGGSDRIIEYHYDIKAPDYVVLNLEGDDGNVNIADWRNDIAIDLSDGDIDLENIKAGVMDIDLEDGDLFSRRLEGELTINCEDGNVTLEEINSPFADISNQDGSVKIRKGKGSFKIRLEDGNCRITNMTAEKLEVRAQDGNVDIQLDGTASPHIRATCQDGNIELEIPQSTDAELQINARSGSINAKLEKARIEADKKDFFRAILGSGKGSIDLSASDGRVTVRQY